MREGVQRTDVGVIGGGIIGVRTALWMADRVLAAGLSQALSEVRNSPDAAWFSCFVNLLKSEEAPEQIVLIVDGPLAGKSEAFAQPQHRFEPGDRPARRFE